MKNLYLLAVLAFLWTGCQGPNESASASGEGANSSELTGGVVPISTVDDQYAGLAQATFAGGCFWCTEAAFERIQGVEAVYSGYTGGSVENPSYELVSSGATDHAEAVRVYYDASVVSYRTLLEVFFVSHDPTQLNRQGPDIGAQYRSAIFYHDESQKQQAESYMSELRQSGKYERPIVTELNPLKEFYKAEEYHQDYYEEHPNQPYIRNVSRPKVKKVEKEFQEILKDKYKA